MPAGYSGTPLVKKLGLRAGMRAHFSGAPDGYFEHTLIDIPVGVERLKTARPPLDFAQLFVRDRATFARRLPVLKNALAKTGMLWVSWPKKTSPLHRDLTETEVREAAFAIGLVDVKVCAVDDDWSGLKLMYRKADR